MIVDQCVRPPFKSMGELEVYSRVRAIYHQVPEDSWPGFMNGMKVPPSILNGSLDLFMEEMKQAGIDLAVIHGRLAAPMFGRTRNADIAELMELHPGKFVALAGIDPTNAGEALAEIRDVASIPGFKGIALDPGLLAQPLHAEDPVLFPIYELCSDSGLAVSIVSSIAGGPDLEYANPVHIQRVATAFPDLRIQIKHGSFPWIAQALSLTIMCPNLWICPDFYHFVRGMPGAQQWVEAAEGMAQRRLTFGSSYPARPLGQSLDDFRSFTFSERATRLALGDNNLAFLGIDR